MTVDGHLIYGSATDVYVVPNLPSDGDQDAQDAAMRVALEAGAEFMTKAQGKSWTEPDGTPTPGRNLVSGRVHLDLDTLPPREAAALRAPASGPLLPIIFPLDWEHTFEIESINGPRRVLATAVPLRLGGQHVGYLAIGRDFGAGLALEGVREDISTAELEAEGLAGLKSLGLHWQAWAGGTGTHTHAGVDDAIDGRDVLECSEHKVAASGVLDPDFLRDAQRLLGCSRIVVALPSQDALWAASANLPASRLDTFARMAEYRSRQTGGSVTPQVFYATDGVIDGIYGGEAYDDSQTGPNTDVDLDLDITESGHLISSAGRNVHVVVNMPEDADQAAHVAALTDALRAGIQHMSAAAGAPIGGDAPLLPVLLPSDWSGRSGGDTDSTTPAVYTRPLRLAGQEVAVVSFARNRSASLDLVARQPDISLDQIEADALSGLKRAGLAWQPWAWGATRRTPST